MQRIIFLLTFSISSYPSFTLFFCKWMVNIEPLFPFSLHHPSLSSSTLCSPRSYTTQCKRCKFLLFSQRRLWEFCSFAMGYALTATIKLHWNMEMQSRFDLIVKLIDKSMKLQKKVSTFCCKKMQKKFFARIRQCLVTDYAKYALRWNPPHSPSVFSFFANFFVSLASLIIFLEEIMSKDERF